jgi:thiamine kinase-like enzyme
MPFIERDDVPIAFCHCDIGPPNLIFPGGLERWRAGQSSVCMIDCEYGAWMPVYWEALKTVFIVYDKKDEWFDMAKRIFPEHAEMIDADWEWQCQTGTTLV